MPALTGVAFIWRSLTFAHPVVDLRALEEPEFRTRVVSFPSSTGIGIFATIYLTPLFLGRVRGFSALQIGLDGFFDRVLPDAFDPDLHGVRPPGATCAGS
ncbi:MAG: hypothetical protein QM796_17300 [Chthoniobacteraceae bacterium]